MKGEWDRTISICVDSFREGIPTGRFHRISDSQEQVFVGLGQLLLSINGCLDQDNFPQAFSELRKFQNPTERKSTATETIHSQKGNAATFIVRILFRQNASWQGTVNWVEGGQEIYFRSALELLTLLDNALDYSKTEQ